MTMILNFPSIQIKRHFSIFSLSFLLVLFSCSSDDGEPKSNLEFSTNTSILQIFDIGNSEGASDIYIGLRINDTQVASTLWAFVVKSEELSSVNSNQMKEAAPTTYSVINVTSISMATRLGDQTDINGNPISNDQQYQVLVYNPEDGTSSQPSQTISLTEVGVLTGEYTGTWNDNIYTDFAISARITASGSSYIGEFFYSGNFVSCCGGTTDGQISFTVDDNNELKNFVYDQDLLNFMGGCPGRYTGSGMADLISFNTDFTGNDCEGPHTNGEIEMTRIR